MLKCADTQMFTTSVARPGQVFKCSNYYIFPSGDGDWTADLLKCPHRSLYLCYRNLAQVFLIYKKIIIDFPFNCYQSTTEAIKMHGKNNRNDEKYTKRTTGEMTKSWNNNRSQPLVIERQTVRDPVYVLFNPYCPGLIVGAMTFYLLLLMIFFSCDKDKYTN